MRANSITKLLAEPHRRLYIDYLFLVGSTLAIVKLKHGREHSNAARLIRGNGGLQSLTRDTVQYK